MAKLNKEALEEFLRNKIGDEAMEGIDITDEALGLLVVDDDDDDNNDDDDGGNDDGEGNNDDNDEGGSDDDNVDGDGNDGTGLENIDVTQLTAGEKMIYDAFMSEKRKSAKNEITALISTSGVGDKHRGVLKRMAKNGVSISVIRETVEDFKEVENTSNRILGRKRIVPKSKVKTTNKTKNGNVPKLGSKEFGKLLANKKK